ncbi:helix-turn-helix domain-containing protein [Nocardia brasiliensis]|uniref:helix-turn-helix domain-containing protein n=1 Tax=Nocardia brasiliensis TaxID=37326 RepID=UPI00245391C2|nr:helix-turn-helix domain-containing protein [Nocardia brasiliensis]
MSFNNVIPGSLIGELTEMNARVAELERENTALRAKLDNRKKLTSRDVTLIRRFRLSAGLTHQELADTFDVNRATVSRILNGTYHKAV